MDVSREIVVSFHDFFSMGSYYEIFMKLSCVLIENLYPPASHEFFTAQRLVEWSEFDSFIHSFERNI